MKDRKYWVIDADIARASGISENPISSNCRSFLCHIKENNKHIVMNKDLMDEWKKHRSLYSKQWLSNMIARKKFLFDRNNSFNDQIDECGLSEKQVKIAYKDSHLINASLDNGKSIASGDDTAREIYVIIAENCNEIINLLWVNPKTSADIIVDACEKKQAANSEWFLKT